MNMDAKDRSPATSADRNASEDIDDIADRATGNGGAGAGAAAGHGPTGNGNGPKKSSSKDPSRPRRKKARRACFACQRAHLTCGTLEFYYPLQVIQSFSCLGYAALIFLYTRKRKGRADGFVD